MWKRKISIKEQYGTLEHFLKGDEPCHYIGQRYIEGTNFYARREWRGVKDTAFAFYKWLCTWVKMAIFVMHDPIRIAKAFWKYRWLSAYLAAPMMVDKWIEGDRGEALRADLYALDCMISDSTDTLWKSLRADRRLGETKWSDVTVAFDYTLPKHIIFGFPGYYAINMQQHAAFMLPLMRKQLGCYYVDQAVACGIPGDMCTLPLVEVGVAVENEYPDIGNCWLTTNNPCDANMMDNTAMWRALSNDGKKAVHPFTTPLMYDDPTTKELGVHEVYSAIEFLEQQFGVPFNWDAFIEHIEDTNEFNRGSLNRWDIYAKSDNGALNSVVQGLFRIYFYQQGGTKYFKKANKKINKVFEKCVRKNIHPFPLARHRALAWSCGSTYYAWPGCPEGRGFDETGEKHVYIVTLGSGCSVKPMCIAQRKYEILNVELKSGDVVSDVLAALPENTRSDVYRIVLRGEAAEPPQPDVIISAVGERFFSLQVRDETSLKRDVWESAGEDNLRGRFLMRLKTAFDEAKTDAEREKITQAARWGLAALDNREEVVRHDD